MQDNMILYINTTDSHKIHCALLDDQKVIAEKSETAQYKQAQKILPLIQELLAQVGSTLEGIGTICVVQGPGPFTSTRVGVSTANALSYALDVPIIGIEVTDIDSFPDVVYSQIKKAKKTIIQPVYNQDPSITKAKKRV